MSDTPSDTVVTKALIAEFIRVRNKMGGASRRLTYAQSQVVSETALLDEYQGEMDMLADAILAAGAGLPPEDDPEAVVTP